MRQLDSSFIVDWNEINLQGNLRMPELWKGYESSILWHAVFSAYITPAPVHAHSTEYQTGFDLNSNFS